VADPASNVGGAISVIFGSQASLRVHYRKRDEQACPWECHSYGNPTGNVPWDGTGINCYGMGMGQMNMSHGQPWR